MSKVMGRPRKRPDEKASQKFSFRVRPSVFMAVESSTAGESGEFLRQLTERAAALIESGEPPAAIVARLEKGDGER